MPLISIIIPCRNEEQHIGKCLDSLISHNYPKESLEILVVDGISEDKTRDIIKDYIEKYHFIRLLDNPEKVTPRAMNIGIRESRGEVVLMVNSHSVLDKDFLKWNIHHLTEIKEADAVGGTLKTISDDNIFSKAIEFVSDSVFGSGGKRYRQRTEPGFVQDTLPYCAYRREVFDKFGIIDETLFRTQDGEFNLRILKGGGKIYFSPKIKSYLYGRSSLARFSRQQFQYGYFKVKIAKKLGWGSIPRQVVPGLFVFSLILSVILSFLYKSFLFLFVLIIGSYFLANIIFSLQISFKKGMKYFLPCFLTFFVMHFSYGLGFLKGIIDFLILGKEAKKDIGITR